MPEDKKDLFTELVMEGFNPIKRLIEYGDYDEMLTPSDIHKITGAIEKHLNSYVEFLKLAKKQARQGK